MIYHHCLNIEVALKNADMLKGAIEVDGDILKTKRQVKRFLIGQRNLGRLYLPLCNCDKFNYIKGCIGHND